jgi:hypothetical protein
MLWHRVSSSVDKLSIAELIDAVASNAAFAILEPSAAVTAELSVAS